MKPALKILNACVLYALLVALIYFFVVDATSQKTVPTPEEIVHTSTQKTTSSATQEIHRVTKPQKVNVIQAEKLGVDQQQPGYKDVKQKGFNLDL